MISFVNLYYQAVQGARAPVKYKIQVKTWTVDMWFVRYWRSDVELKKIKIIL